MMESFLKFVIAGFMIQQVMAIKIIIRPRPLPRCARMFEEYKECGSACPPSCDDTPMMCTEQCVAGCYCIAGYVRNSADGSCCRPEECPSVEPEPEPEPEVICPSHEVYYECGSSCPDTCTNYKDVARLCTMQCVQGCFCEPGYVRNLADGTCCKVEQCPALTPAPTKTPTKAPQICPANSVYTTCGTACPLTCENRNSPPQMCTMQCKIGCECSSGYVKKKDGSCCLPKDC